MGIEKEPRNPTEYETDSWDLEQTLRGTKNEDFATGVKPKCVVPMWEGLTMGDVEGVKNIVKTSLDAFVYSFKRFWDCNAYLRTYQDRKRLSHLKILLRINGIAPRVALNEEHRNPNSLTFMRRPRR